MVSSLVLCSSTVGVVAWSIAFYTCSGFSSLSTHCAMTLVWTPILFSVDIPFLCIFRLSALVFGVYVYLSVSVLTLLVAVSNCSLSWLGDNFPLKVCFLFLLGSAVNV